jgi:hypothetical protein
VDEQDPKESWIDSQYHIKYEATQDFRSRRTGRAIDPKYATR